MRKFFISVTVLVVIILSGLGISNFLVSKEKKRANELTSNALPAFGDPLVTDSPTSNDTSVLSQLTPKKDQGPTPQELKSYEQYISSKQMLHGDIKAGDGIQAVAGKTVAVGYRGYLINGQLFDKTVDKPFVLKLGDHKVIPGFEQGIVGMKVGGKRRLIIPPALGYGNQPQGGIPANSLLIFDIDLIAVQ